jgi:copper transport protein
VLQVSPDLIVLGFADEIGSGSTISVDCDAEPITLPATEVIDETSLQVEITTGLPAGPCVARYRVTDTDGQETATGNITFVVQNDSEPAAPDDASDVEVTDATTTPTTIDADTDPDASSVDATVVNFSVSGRGDAAVWLTRLVSTLAIATLFGALLVITAAWPEGVEYLVTIKFLRVVWGVAAVGTFFFMAFAAAAVTPDGGGGPFSPGTWGDLLDAGWAGRAVLLRMVLVLGSVWVAFRPDRAIDPTAQLLALGIPGLAAATIGLSRTIGDLAAIGALIGIAHALAMSVWVGGVVLLARVVLSGPGDEDLVHAVRGFGRVSTPAILVTIVTGLVQMIRLDGGELFSSGHGRIVVLKTIVVAGMIFVAFSARQFVAQRMNRAQHMSVPLADRLRRAFGAEAAFGVATLALSSLLVGWVPPNIDATVGIDYAIVQEHGDASDALDVRLSFTDNEIGLVGIEVLLREPIEGLTGLTVVLTAPGGSPTVGSIRQPVPLVEPGYAVREELVGLPLDFAGPWIVRVEASTPAGVISSTEQVLEILNADGTQAPAATGSTPANVVEIPITDG